MEYRELTEDERSQVPGVIPGMLVVGAVDETGVVGACGIILSPHLDPLWIREDRRGKSGWILIRLWKAVRNKLLSLGASSCTAAVTSDYPGPELERVIEKLSVHLAGGQELDARVWLIPLSGTLSNEDRGE